MDHQRWWRTGKATGFSAPVRGQSTAAWRALTQANGGPGSDQGLGEEGIQGTRLLFGERGKENGVTSGLCITAKMSLPLGGEGIMDCKCTAGLPFSVKPPVRGRVNRLETMTGNPLRDSKCFCRHSLVAQGQAMGVF
ncbi:unnamed protein product [Boreogadus saida]